jgi:hypothetical protein
MKAVKFGPNVNSLLIMLCVLLVNLPAHAQKMTSDTSAIKQLEIDWHTAYVTHDINLISNVLAADFINL